MPRRVRIAALWLAIGLPLYVLSTGPVARLTDAGYLPEAIGYLYLPLRPLGYIPGASTIFRWYLFEVWNVDNGGDITL